MGQTASFVARWRATIVALAIAAALSVTWVAGADADGPGSGTPSVVALGDSYISGEAGRWAGNSNDLACSGARVATFTNGEGKFDFYGSGGPTTAARREAARARGRARTSRAPASR